MRRIAFLSVVTPRVRRRIYAALALLALCIGSVSALSAQSLVAKDGKVYVSVTPNTMAVTYCSPISKDSTVVLTLINSAYMGDSVVLEGVKVHEATHRYQLMNDPSLCWTTPQKLLPMEVEAYCVEAHFLTRYGLKSDSLYWRQLDKLQFAFNGKLTWEAITRAWYLECGGMLELGKK